MLKKRLTIQVDNLNQEEDEAVLLENEFNRLCKLAKPNYAQKSNELQDELRRRIIEYNIPAMNQILSYMENENFKSDLSYKW